MANALTEIRRHSPEAADSLQRRAAWVVRQMGSAEELVARLRRDRSRVTRYRNGTDPHNPVAASLALHHKLGERAWILIAEEKAVVEQARIVTATLPELEKRLAELKDVEESIAAFNREMRFAQHEDNHEIAAQNDILLIARLEERVAVRRQIAELKRRAHTSA